MIIMLLLMQFGVLLLKKHYIEVGFASFDALVDRDSRSWDKLIRPSSSWLVLLCYSK